MNKQVVIVGASRGIGIELTRFFSRLPDFTIFALARNCENLKKEFGQSEQVKIFSFDLEGDIPVQLANIPFSEEGIDFLINN